MAMVSVSVCLSISGPVPILPLRRLPTEDRPWILLYGDQRLYGADAGIDNMSPAPVLDDAIWLVRLMVCVLVVIYVLGEGSQAKKADQAKRGHCETEGGKLSSHHGPPI
jgi:hypothetical protein